MDGAANHHNCIAAMDWHITLQRKFVHHDSLKSSFSVALICAGLAD